MRSATHHSSAYRARTIALLSSVLLVATGLGALAAPAGAAPAETIDLTTDMVDGPVYAMARAGDRLYLGGSFTWAGPKTGGGVPVNLTDGSKRDDSRAIEGMVAAVTGDGAGGWVFGGSFFKAGGFFRNNVARMLPDGRIDSVFNPNVKGGAVSEVAVSNQFAYIAGTFSTVGGTSRNGLAKVDLATGVLQPWSPNVPGTITSLAVTPDGATVYVGTTTGLSAVDASTAATSSVPVVGGVVHALLVVGTTLYLGGDFDSVAGQPRSDLAALDLTSGHVTDWAPATDGQVLSMAAHGAFVYVAGSFTTLAGVPRPSFGRVGTDSRGSVWAATKLTAAPGGTPVVNAIAVSDDGSRAFIGGNFVRSGSQPRHRAAGYTTAEGSLTAWQPNADEQVQALSPSGEKVFVAGDFKMLNGAARGNLVALDATSGKIDRTFTTDTDGPVRALAGTTDGSRLFIGGDFGYVNGTRRRTVAAVQGVDGSVIDSWTADTNGAVRALAVHGDRLYVGGPFTAIGGVARSRLAAASVSTGSVDAQFAPSLNDGVRALQVSPDGSSVFAGGRFNRADGLTRPGLAQLDATTGRATAFAPSGGGVVIAVELSPDGSVVYGADESNITYAYRWSTSNSPSWTLKTGGDVQAIAASSTEVYVGGHFMNIPAAKLVRPHLASVDAVTGTPTAWDPKPDGRFWGVWALEIVPGGLAVAGEFTRVGTDNRDNFAVLPGTP